MNVKHKESLKNEDIKVSPPTIKDFLCLFGYINHSTAALFLWYTTQKLGFSEARENMYYYISYSHFTTFKQIKNNPEKQTRAAINILPYIRNNALYLLFGSIYITLTFILLHQLKQGKKYK